MSRALIPPFKAIYSIENLYSAWHKVALGRSSKPSILAFYRNLDKNLASIALELLNGTYKPGPHNRFLVKEPKERIIAASPIRDRVVQHALMNYYSPAFDRHLIYDCYACRIDKGTHKAILRAFHFAKSARYFLKLDVKKYFDSIDHSILKALLTKIIKDNAVLDIFYRIIDSSNIQTGKGIPIGNLTSQYFANYYLSPFDHFFKESCHARHYVRYMDDIVIFSKDKNQINNYFTEAEKYIMEKLNLAFKPKISGKISDCIPFLGFLIKSTGIFLQQKTKKRYMAKVTEIEHKRKNNIYTDYEAGRRIESVTAHLHIARSKNFRNNILHRRVFGD